MLAVLALCIAPRSSAATIHRCEASNGVLVFTDQQCHLLGTAYRIDGGDEPVRRARPGMQRVDHSRGGGFRFGVGCAARSPEGMLSALRLAIESGDVNQISGLYDWNGAKRSHAMGVVKRMQRIVKRDLLTIEFDYADYAPTYRFSNASLDLAEPAKPALPDLVVAHYAWGKGGGSEGERFSLRRDNGCIWLAG